MGKKKTKKCPKSDQIVDLDKVTLINEPPLEEKPMREVLEDLKEFGLLELGEGDKREKRRRHKNGSEEEVRKIYQKAVGIVDEEEYCDDEAEKMAKKGAKEELEKLLKGFDRMKLDEVRDKLEEIIWGIGYTEGYEVGYYEGKTGHSYALKDREE